MPSPVRVSRRTAIAASLAATGVLTACDIDPPARDAAGPSPTPRPPEDRELVLRTVTRIRSGESVAEAAAQAFPALAGLLSPLAAAHAEHRALLVEALPDGEPEPPEEPALPRAERSALARVRRVERRVLAEVEAACAGAASGDLARVLASIAASTAQHLVLVDRELAR